MAHCLMLQGPRPDPTQLPTSSSFGVWDMVVIVFLLGIMAFCMWMMKED